MSVAASEWWFDSRWSDMRAAREAAFDRTGFGLTDRTKAIILVSADAILFARRLRAGPLGSIEWTMRVRAGAGHADLPAAPADVARIALDLYRARGSGAPRKRVADLLDRLDPGP